MRAVSALALGSLVAACPAPQSPAPVTPCRRAIAGFASADPQRLVTLPATCGIADAGAELHSLDAISTGELGEPIEVARVHHYAAPKLERVRIWERDGRVVLVEAEFPPAPVADYIRALGEPQVRLPQEELPDPELVWPARGIMLVAAGPTGASRVGLFPAQSLADYQRHVRLTDRTRIEP